MNLSNNLQNLRKQKEMSQEELAEKLNVSRQAISKWETGETIPETEKIITLCEIFNCSMDTLVKGNINNSNKNAKETYDRFMNKFSKGIAIGILLILIGVTILLTIIGLAPNKEALRQYTLIGVAILLIFVICAVPIFIILGIEMENTQKKYQNLTSFYSEEEIDTYNHKFSLIVACCISLILIGVVVLVLIYGFQLLNINSTLPIAIFMIFITVSVPILVHSGIEKSKYDMTIYRTAHKTISKECEEKIGKYSAVIMISMTIIYFILGFIFNLWRISWLVYPIGGMICGIIAVILNKED